VQEAIARWAAAGLDAQQWNILNRVTVGIADFPGPWLGMAFPGAIWIDQNAAGFGWYLDPTPAEDSEFPATPGSPAYGKIDLLTVVEHELGHELGLADDTGADLMGIFLPAGVRRTPTAHEMGNATPMILPASALIHGSSAALQEAGSARPAATDRVAGSLPADEVLWAALGYHPVLATPDLGDRNAAARADLFFSNLDGAWTDANLMQVLSPTEWQPHGGA
jgi:hypothetical protein